jgi:hypothetical protein
MVIDKLSHGELIGTYFKKEAVSSIVKNLEQGYFQKDYQATVIWTIRSGTVVRPLFQR